MRAGERANEIMAEIRRRGPISRSESTWVALRGYIYTHIVEAEEGIWNEAMKNAGRSSGP